MAKNHVMWQMAAVGALRCHALETLGRFIRAWTALAPSLKQAPRTCEAWVESLDWAMSDLRALSICPIHVFHHLPPVAR